MLNSQGGNLEGELGLLRNYSWVLEGDGGHFSAPALAILCQGTECQFSGENLLAGRGLLGFVTSFVVYSWGYSEIRAMAREERGGRLRGSCMKIGNEQDGKTGCTHLRDFW